MMGRSKLKTLRATTLKTFFEVCKSLSIKEGKHYKYNQMSGEIKFFNGSEIVLIDLFAFPADPDFDRLGSLEIAGAFIDEVSQVSEKAKNMVRSRIRHKLDEFNLIPKLYMSCNPSKGWVYNEFYKKDKDNELEAYKCFIPALPTDNQFITKHYVASLEKLDIISRKRLLLGEWEYSDSTSIFNYDSIVEMFQSDMDSYVPTANKYITVDVARFGKDKTCITVWDGLQIIEIIEYSKLGLDVQKVKIEALKMKYGIKNSFIAIDTDGVGGGLADLFPNCTQIVNNAKALNGDNYQNLKTQLYYKLAESINKDEIKIFNCNDDIKIRLTQELQVIKQEKIDMDAKIAMSSKDQIKKLIGRSPDVSDSMAFRMYYAYKNRRLNIAFG